MFLLYHSIQVGFQLAILLFTSAGWGYFIHRAVRQPAIKPPPGDILLCGAAGLCLCFLVLQNLVYAGIRLEWSAWFGLLIAVGGLVCWWRDRAAPLALRRPLLSPKHWPWVTAGLIVFCFQGAALIYHGPADYYGHAHQDHVNYVQLAQFLVEKPFGTSLGDVGLNPWLVKAIDLKDMRLGQSVANGYVAVASLTDAKAAYGTTSLFFLGVLAATVTALLGRCGVERRLAWLGGIWAGLLPAITKTHLDGFFSQTIVLFVLPALGLALLAARRNRRLGWLATALFLAFLLGAYTEIYIIGLASVTTLAASMIDWPLRRRFGYAATAMVASLALLFPYVLRSLAFMAFQYRNASNPELLSDLMPRAGTWQGWAEIFVGTPAVEPLYLRGQLLAGFGLLALVLLGLASRNFSRRIQLLALTAVPAGVLGVLLSAPVLAKYPFGKLLTLFAPLAIACGTLGLARSGALLARVFSPRIRLAGLARPPGWPRSRYFALVVTSLFVVVAASNSWGQLRAVIFNGANLAAVNSPAARAVFKDLEAHPDRTYLLKEPHVILNAWLCFHARHSRVYVDVDLIGDRPVPSEQFEFRRLPRNAGEVWLLTGEGAKFYAQVAGTPEIIVRNPQGIDRAGLLTWYWVGDALEIEIVSFSPGSQSQRLSLRALSGPANAAAERTVSLSRRNEAEKQTRTFAQDARLEFTVLLQPGSNYFDFRVDAPAEWQHLPGDARKLMVRIQELSLALAPPATE